MQETAIAVVPEMSAWTTSGEEMFRCSDYYCCYVIKALVNGGA